MIDYKYLTEEDRAHFLERGWIQVPNAVNPQYLDPWMENLWVRLGEDPNDPSTWKEEYLKMPRHREVPYEEYCTPEAWGKLCEIVGGENRMHPYRERYAGDQFIINFGSDKYDGLHEKGEKPDPQQATGYHIDNDWYRQFLDSAGNALTLIFLYTDVLENGGGTFLVEDAIPGVCKYLEDHPEGLDHPYDELVQHAYQCKKFTQIVGKKGDLFITHQLLPHSHAPNYRRYARVITNPHINMRENHNLDRADGDYNLCEQVILKALGRDHVSFTPTRDRLIQYPRTAFFKVARVKEELARMQADFEAKGLDPESVDSVYLRGENAVQEHKKRNGYDKEWGPNGVIQKGTGIGVEVRAVHDDDTVIPSPVVQ
ncbi:uncharacterized protein I303_101454 [Kwoniella dejecticola CBS 10117]|uniref:Uncharacterized protein n=1 Tax=Kwoniella dejecticola CBS 10117 TaxID=1296121 RepID=A0A1A6AHU0_9TREE|nr:uncharacterized protein I303_01463 [Kwoniella dejecticola CBS 10117]OBR89634.1 hypothetical protein I303_01463 [Kwoniella dejecticola CBS 10117]